MSSNRTYFRAFLRSAFDKGDYTTDDVIAFVLPLFREVSGLHEAGQVAPFGKEEALFLAEQGVVTGQEGVTEQGTVTERGVMTGGRAVTEQGPD